MKNYNQFINDLSSLVAINSIEGKKKLGKPFGDAPAKALKTFLQIADRMGFKTKNHKNYIGELSIGEGEEVGVIGHLDIVPAGDGWDTDPFTLVEKDGCLYGRGVEDDKGPTLACLYALKEVIDEGYTFNRKIRFFAGTNEETGWKDVEYFNKKKGGFPKYGFSPDGGFPATYAEKGMYEFHFVLPALKNFTDVKGGTVINAVCSRCSVKPLFEPKGYEKFGLIYDGERLVSNGVSAHGSTPHMGKNAILPMFEYFLECGENVEDVINCFFKDYHGIFQMKNEQGNVTLSPDVICQENGLIKLSCDVRIPAPLTVYDVCDKTCLFGYNFKVTERHPPVYTQKDGWFVNALVSAYNTIMQEDKQAISIGGSTFARAFENGCSIGGSLDKGCAHQANERVSVEGLMKTFQIYKQIFINLAESK